MAYATLSLGSNMGNKLEFISQALSALEHSAGHLQARSSNWRTPPWGPIPQGWFINICIGLETPLSPQNLLQTCLQIEKNLGRSRDIRWGPRTIDIDILTYDSQILRTPSLTLPHPRMLERAFVLAPLAEIAPDLWIEGRSIKEALNTMDLTDLEKLSPSLEITNA
jgi:2-amino-4-hydroxy-6-hydroxymethyldihydropteridine diphosphokinase